MVTIASIWRTTPECRRHQSDCRPRAPPQACTRLDTRIWFTEQAIDDAIAAVTMEMGYSKSWAKQDTVERHFVRGWDVFVSFQREAACLLLLRSYSSFRKTEACDKNRAWWQLLLLLYTPLIALTGADRAYNARSPNFFPSDQRRKCIIAYGQYREKVKQTKKEKWYDKKYL